MMACEHRRKFIALSAPGAPGESERGEVNGFGRQDRHGADFLKQAGLVTGGAALASSVLGSLIGRAPPRPPVAWDQTADVVIVGGGGAGLAAAVEAARAGASVIVLEKAAVTGGSTTLSGGVIQAAGTPVPEAVHQVPGRHAREALPDVAARGRGPGRRGPHQGPHLRDARAHRVAREPGPGVRRRLRPLPRAVLRQRRRVRRPHPRVQGRRRHRRRRPHGLRHGDGGRGRRRRDPALHRGPQPGHRRRQRRRRRQGQGPEAATSASAPTRASSSPPPASTTTRRWPRR